jgi:hypothetical protein
VNYQTSEENCMKNLFRWTNDYCRCYETDDGVEAMDVTVSIRRGSMNWISNLELTATS